MYTIKNTKTYEEIQKRAENYRQLLIQATNHEDIIKYASLYKELSYLIGYMIGVDEAKRIVEEKKFTKL